MRSLRTVRTTIDVMTGIQTSRFRQSSVTVQMLTQFYPMFEPWQFRAACVELVYFVITIWLRNAVHNETGHGASLLSGGRSLNSNLRGVVKLITHSRYHRYLYPDAGHSQ